MFASMCVRTVPSGADPPGWKYLRVSPKGGAAVFLILLALLHGGAAAAAPFSVDASSFPAIRLYVPTGEAAPSNLVEDGKPVAPQAILAAGERPPLLAALVLDTSGSMDTALPQIQAAASALVRRLGPNDLFALVRFSSAVEVISPPTHDAVALGLRIASLRAEGATALYDAVAKGLEQARSISGGGLRAVILLTDGKDEGEGPEGTPGSALRFEPLRQRLIAARIPLFILGLGKAVDREVLDALAAASGGRAFYADQAGDIRGLLDSVASSLMTVRGYRYVSPRPNPDGSLHKVTGRLADGTLWQSEYLAPQDGDVLWRWPVTVQDLAAPGRRRAMCGVGALSAEGTWVLAFAPLTLLHGDGTVAGSFAEFPGFRPERASVLEDSTGLLFGGAASASYSHAPPGVKHVSAAPPNWVALSPAGSAALRLVAGPEGAPARIEAANAVTDTPLWSVSCPGSTCDRLSGAAIGDDGVAIINLTGALYRISADGKLSPPRPEVFFGPVSLSADGKRAAAVVWQGAKNSGGVRALLMDEALRPIETVALQVKSTDVPPLAAVSPNGNYLAVLDDLRVFGASVSSPEAAGRRPWRTLVRPAPTPAPCDRTLQLDNVGRVLVSDGESLTLLRGLANP